ncbi:DUF134 domain-containing protein [Clostridium polynesiense]|uniref:DUF134 domain-containing protein n=1 Tax=Clostridium polynesiense TaxID=1325933 RepID=UPI000590FE56|nr:DUF134 domain-containing protein [Clostridium polynesiense]
MPRPRKWRRVCCLPDNTDFGPLNSNGENKDFIIMTVDEYETIRLIDLEGLTQEECSIQMNIARTTVQRIYNEARIKLADSLVNGRILKIEGGDYELCHGAGKYCGRGRCCRGRREDRSGKEG